MWRMELPRALPRGGLVVTIRAMEITFDPAKDSSNQRKHGVSLAEAQRFEWQESRLREDTRRDYGERRVIAIGYIGSRLHVIVCVDRKQERHIISLRPARLRELHQYADLKPGTQPPSEDEDAAIDRGIEADPDTYELSASDLKQMQRATETSTEPRVTEQVTLRLDEDIVAAFKAGGPGWQLRMNEALRTWLHTYRP